MYHSALHVFQSRVHARLPSVLIFYRGERSFFCKQWLRRWLSIRGLSARLRQLDAALLLVSSQSQGKAFSVADQLAGSRRDLHDNVLFFGDPDNALAHFLNSNGFPAPVITNPDVHRAHGWLFEHGMVQPAVLAVFQHAVLYHWSSRPSFLNGAGKLDRPDPWHVWDAIESHVERLLKSQRAISAAPAQSPSETSHRSAHVPAAAAADAAADAPQSPVLSELNAPQPVHVVEAKMLPTASTVNTHSSERSSSPEQFGATIQRLSSTLNALSSEPRKSPFDTDANDVIALPHILQHVFSTPPIPSAEQPVHPHSPQSGDAHLQSSSWYDRPDTELHASQGKLHQFSADHTAPPESVVWDRLQLLGRIQGSQSSLQSSASSDHRSPDPPLTSPEKLDAKFTSHVLNDEYASSETDGISIRDMRDTQESDEHQYSQLFARISALERQSTNRSFRSLLNAESQGPSSGDFREPLEGSNTSLGSDVVDCLVRKARSVRTSDSNLMSQLREGMSFPSTRIDEEGENMEAGVFDILRELSDHLHIQEKRNSRKSLKSTAVRPVSYMANAKPDGSARSFEREGSVETGPLTSTSFRNVPRVGIRDYSGAPLNEPLPIRRDRTTKGIVPELSAIQPSTKSLGSLVSEDVPAVLKAQQSQNDELRHAASLQSDASSNGGKTPLLDVESSPDESDGIRSETPIHDEYEAYDEFLVAEYEVEERMEERQSGASKLGAQRERPLSVGPHHVWVDEEQEDLRPIRSETSPLDKALSKFSGAQRAEGGMKSAFGLLRRSARGEERPRRLDSLKAMVLGRRRASGAGDGADALRLTSGAVMRAAVEEDAAGARRAEEGRRSRTSRAARRAARPERRWWTKRRDGDAQRDKGLVVTASMAAFLRSRRKAR